jgi:hypothetical protein
MPDPHLIREKPGIRVNHIAIENYIIIETT